jgi:UDPglucose 6-dehydrogenase
MARKVIAACGQSARGKTVAILGLTFKPDTDDMRDAPSLAIIAGLIDAGATVKAYDPEGMEQARPLLGNIIYAQDIYDCAKGADVLVIVTEWNAFRALDFERLRSVMATPNLVDLRNVYREEDVSRYGFSYSSVGRSEGSTYAQPAQ